MKDIQSINEMVRGNNYRICFKDDRSNEEVWVYGEVVNYSNSGVYILCEDRFLQIPHKAVVWMLPNGLTRQKKEKMKQKALEETAKKIKETVDTVYNLTGEIPSIFATKEIMNTLCEMSESEME